MALGMPLSEGAKDRRIDELERCLRLCWGAMLLADTVVPDRNVRAAFRRVDAECRKTGLLARAEMSFVDAGEVRERERAFDAAAGHADALLGIADPPPEIGGYEHERSAP